MTPPSSEETVRVMLAAAGITPTDEEFATFVADYPLHRSKLDTLYTVPTIKEEEPQTIFSPYV